MKFDDLDKKMRVYETAHDHKVLPGIYMVLRLDGRGFTKLTRDVLKVGNQAFCDRFHTAMVEVTAHLMECGARVVYGYTQSDEISLLLHRDDDIFGRKERKLISVYASEAGSRGHAAIGHHVAFDCRISQLPSIPDVIDYFRWRQQDSARNALNSHCYWMLRSQGRAAGDATSALHGLSVAEKHELLFKNGINFAELPGWQKNGTGIVWGTVMIDGVDPRTNTVIPTERTYMRIDENLPIEKDYGTYITRLIMGTAK